MRDGRVLEVDPILGVEALPGIAPPAIALGTRPIDSLDPAQPLALAEVTSFEIAMSGTPMLTAQEDAAPEHGKRRR
ncbi:MAG TPA: hypothetical protein VG496_09175 [Myxococcales bacterium]|nr:hypothetical protein [Myxococcales bacterium]